VLDRRVIVVTLSWLAISIAAFQAPQLVLFAWPMTGLFLLWALLGSTANLRSAMPLREPLVVAPHRALALRLLLGALICCAIGGVVTSVVPSLQYRSPSGVVYTYGMSIIVAPILWMTILATAVRALRIRSPRRLAIVAITALIAWPLLLGISAVSQPWFDIDDNYRVLSPNVISAYVVAAVLTGGAALALAFLTARIARSPIVVVPPRAALLPE
jgi:hypothetical protein